MLACFLALSAALSLLAGVRAECTDKTLSDQGCTTCTEENAGTGDWKCSVCAATRGEEKDAPALYLSTAKECLTEEECTALEGTATLGENDAANSCTATNVLCKSESLENCLFCGENGQATACTKCAKGYKVGDASSGHEGECIAESSPIECTEALTAAHCKTCAEKADTCTECAQNYFLNEVAANPAAADQCLDETGCGNAGGVTDTTGEVPICKKPEEKEDCLNGKTAVPGCKKCDTTDATKCAACDTDNDYIQDKTGPAGSPLTCILKEDCTNDLLAKLDNTDATLATACLAKECASVEGCASCDATTEANCKTCQEGYTDTAEQGSPATCQKNDCQEATTHCALCLADADKTCLECSEGYEFGEKGSADEGKCVEITTPSGCANKDLEHCKTCASATAEKCDVCEDGYSVSEETSTLGKCVAIPAGLCAEFSSYPNDACAGPIFTPACYGFIGCDACGVDVATHTPYCLHCAYGKFEGGKCTFGEACEGNVPNCKTCKKEGSGNDAPDDVYTCSECNDGYTVKDGLCVPKETVANCAVYKDKECEFCNAGYILKDKKCTEPETKIDNCKYYAADGATCVVCQEGFMPDGEGKCKTAADTCKKDGENCAECGKDGTCNLCPKGKGFDGSECKACLYASECVTIGKEEEPAEPSKCLENNNPEPDLDSGRVFCTPAKDECPSPCKECKDGKCTECHDGYKLENDACVACPEGCATCTASECTTCAMGYKKSEKTCVACPAGCWNCEGAEDGECVEKSCAPFDLETGRNYSQVEGKCVLCVEGCGECDKDGKCLEGGCLVKGGYYQVKEGEAITCEKCGMGCKECSTDEGGNTPDTPTPDPNPEPNPNPDEGDGGNTDPGQGSDAGNGDNTGEGSGEKEPTKTNLRLRAEEEPACIDCDRSAGYYLDSESGTCKQCADNKIPSGPTDDKCSGGCLVGYYKDGTDADAKCVSCGENCASCTDGDKCGLCALGYENNFKFDLKERDVVKAAGCQPWNAGISKCAIADTRLSVNSYGIPIGMQTVCEVCEDGTAPLKGTKLDGITYYTVNCGGGGNGPDSKIGLIVGCVVAGVVVIVAIILGCVFGVKACKNKKAKQAGQGSNEQALQPINSDVASN